LLVANQLVRIKTLPHLYDFYLAESDFVAPVYALTNSIQIERFLSGLQCISKTDLKYDLLVKRLGESSAWKRVSIVTTTGEYAIKGDLVWLWPIGYPQAIRISFFDQDCEYISLFDVNLGGKVADLDELWLNFGESLDIEDMQQIQWRAEPAISKQRSNFAVFTTLRPDVQDDYQYPPLFWNRLDIFQHELERLFNEGYQLQVYTKHPLSLSPQIWEWVKQSQLDKHSKVLKWAPANLPAGFVSPQEKIALFTDREIFGTIYLAGQAELEGNSSKLLRHLEGEISVGDYVVHEDHGICIYAGLTQELISGQLRDYLQLNFAGEDQVLLPVEQVSKLSRYIGNDGLSPELSKLSRGGWEKLKQNLRAAVAIKAHELVEHYARRELANAPAIPNIETEEFKQFVEKFAYVPTKDQINSANEILHDLDSTTPMNRLLVGDVGFGKTEVAMRAAFRAVESGFQVAVLCPTTVLAAQHEEVFTQRFKDFGINVQAVSRFKSSKQNNQAIDEAKAGKVDILIGTHRLLSKDVGFKRLGLLIVDEEQRFGVGQKERVKQLNYGTHYLSVSATPIPRTLSMALTNIQEISIISEPPPHRKPVTTEIVKDNWTKVQEAISVEQQRGGQIYFVHNRVQDLPTVQAKLQKLFPGIKLVAAHGQMSPQTLDAAMTKFYKREADVLLTTTIIENGLDMPNVNTIIIHKAENFGLSQLYQLRGRVGRSDRQAFCYLLTSKTFDSEEMTALGAQATSASAAAVAAARQKTADRLEALVESSHLGAGFSVASRDLEIRGAGDLLGEKQHGHISKVGYVLYMQLLAQEIARLKKAKHLLETKPEYLTI
jgi:transcription-repair coupling factor (superfamily II helicase)